MLTKHTTTLVYPSKRLRNIMKIAQDHYCKTKFEVSVVEVLRRCSVQICDKSTKFHTLVHFDVLNLIAKKNM